MTEPVAVTGAAGFVGQELVAQLLAAGYPVRALVHRTPLPISHPGLETVTGSIKDDAALTRLMTGCGASFTWRDSCADASRRISCRSMPTPWRVSPKRHRALVPRRASS